MSILKKTRLYLFLQKHWRRFCSDRAFSKQWTIAQQFADGHQVTGELSLIVPPDPWSVVGSRGDQAMIMATVDFVRSRGYALPVHILTNDATHDAEVLGIKDLKPVHDWDSRFDQWVIERSSDYRHVFVLGADCIDGHYFPAGSARFLAYYDVFTRFGADVRMLGSSWSQKPYRGMRRILNRLASGAPLVMRDAVSLERVRKLAPNRELRLVADAAFCMVPRESDRTRPLTEWVHARKSEGKRVVAVNAHGMFNDVADVPAWCAAFARVLNEVAESRKIALVLVPHDNRKNVSDVPVLRKVRQGLGPDQVLLIEEVLNADEIKHVISHCDGLIAGRMHISIGALGMGVPVLGLAYQGKFQGLWQHFNLPESLCLAPSLIIKDESAARRRIGDFIDRLDEYRQIVQGRRDAILALARKNFEANA